LLTNRLHLKDGAATRPGGTVALRPTASFKLRRVEFLPYVEVLRAVQRGHWKGESRPVDTQVEAIRSVDGSTQQCLVDVWRRLTAFFAAPAEPSGRLRGGDRPPA
jgi:hypothetical protein